MSESFLVTVRAWQAASLRRAADRLAKRDGYVARSLRERNSRVLTTFLLDHLRLVS
ncbi:MAG: hypothetical protein U1A77_16670 [Pirellulales bacterium]